MQWQTRVNKVQTLRSALLVQCHPPLVKAKGHLCTCPQ